MKRTVSIALVLIFSFLFATSYAEDIEIKELNISFKIPDHIEWATRTEGNYDIMLETYSMNRPTLVAYMEQGGEYFKGVDPTSDLRILFAAMPANPDEKNYAARTNEEILELNPSLEALIDDTYTPTVYTTLTGNKFLKVQYELLNQTFCICLTCIDGNFYFFNVRGTNVGYINTMASYLIETLEIDTTKVAKEQQIVAIKNATLFIPGNWEKTDYKSYDPRIDAIAYAMRGSDGLMRYITCNTMDICSEIGFPEGLRALVSGDQYTQQFTIVVAGNQNIDASMINKYSFGGKNYFGFRNTSDDITPSVCMVTLENGYVYSYIFETYTEDPFTDEYYPAFEEILNSAVYIQEYIPLPFE